jgi:lipopolysaccharide transport system permease protein
MEIEIKPAKVFLFNFKELVEYKELLYFLTWKDIKIKYKQAILGFTWALIQPALMMFVFIVFRKVVFIWTGNSDIPYPLFVLSGILFWNLFSTGILQSSNSIVSNAHIIKKIYFPRIFFPISAIMISLFDFLMGLVVYIPVMIFYDYYPSAWTILTFPLAIILTIIVSIGIGSYFSALNVKYRDIKYVIPFFTQLLFFISPVFYSHSFITNKFLQYFYYLNPVTGILELVRFGLFNTSINIQGIIISTITALISFILGIIYFRKFENTFADIA